MKKIDLVAMSIRNLLRRKFRTFLTVLGVVIGCTSIILMLSLGLAMDKNMEEQMNNMGNVTLVSVHCMGNGNGELFDENDIKEMAKVENVECVIPRLDIEQINLSCGKYRTFQSWFNITVLSPEQVEILGYSIAEGRNLDEGEEDAILIGPEILRCFTKNGKEPDWSKEMEPMPFDMETEMLTCDVLEYDRQTGKPVLESENGKFRKPKDLKIKVVGMLDGSNYQEANTIIMTRGLYEKLKKERAAYRKALGWYNEEDEKNDKKETYYEATVKVNDRENVTGVVEALNNLGYEAYSDAEWLSEMEQQSKSRQLALGALGIVSFIVAAIGIANTMMMSIYERTKEIGIMKVIGAKIKDIQYMFLMESLLIGFIGGVAGALISFILSLIMNASGEKIAVIMGMYGSSNVSLMPPQLLGAGILFSMIIGLISGYFPARKAMKLSALSAIRTE
ncbi:MAG: ABC transporter permease [Cellulosilyticum sp.]|nr:ABC transporter permease [Cellulosilyticum sp.]